MANIPGPLERIMDRYNEDRGISTEGSPRTYRDNTAPSDPEPGDFWYDTSTGVLRVYDDSGGTTTWVTADPVRVTEEAQTFAESDVSVSTTNAAVNSNQVEISGGDSTISQGSLGSTTTDFDSRGLKINPNYELDKIDVTINSNHSDPVQDVFVANADTNEKVVEDTSGHNAGDTVTLTATFKKDQGYWVGTHDDGSEMTIPFNSSVSFPETSTEFDVPTGGYNISPDDGSTPTESDTWYTFDSIKGYAAGKSGDATVSFTSGSPSDAQGWDLATVRRNADGETAQVDIEDDSGTVLLSNVEGQIDLSDIDKSKDLQFGITLSRNDTNNNPRVTYASRRYVR